MEDNATEVLFQTRSHASRPFAPKYPPQQLNEGVKGSILSLLSYRGVSQLKERWSKFRNPNKVNKWVSLFVSPTGERVAIAVGNQITILQQGDDYKEPCGVFSSTTSSWFACGTWSESHDVLGVVDNSDVLYFVKGNGEEILRITKKNLRVPVPIVGLILPVEDYVAATCLCTFNVLALDGFLHRIEISKDPSSSISPICTSNNHSTSKRQFPENVYCMDYNAEISLLAIVGSAISVSFTSVANAGSCCLSLWHRARGLDLDPLFSNQFQGLFSKPRDSVGSLTSPKVLISPQGKFIATLDVIGGLDIFKLDEERCSLSTYSFAKAHDLQNTSTLSCGERRPLSSIIDFVWWSDQVLAFVNMRGSVIMFDIIKGIKLLESDKLYSMPILESAKSLRGHFFLLESIFSEERASSGEEGMGSTYHRGQTLDARFNQLEISKLRWRLMSFSRRSVSEMYSLLISERKYQEALDFSEHHCLDRDEVLKSQWLDSEQGINDINSLLTNITDQDFVLSQCLEKIGSTEDSVKALLVFGLRLIDHYKFCDPENHEGSKIWNFRVARLKLLQFRDRLETFLGINMGRFSVQEYKKFRGIPLNEAAVTLSENGKIGALNLLFKRHPYSLAPHMLKVLSAVPETVPVQTYGQLLPGRQPPSNISLREKDWVECDEMVNFIKTFPAYHSHFDAIQIQTEPIVQSLGSFWPSADELCSWYKNRAIEIDTFSGQLDNCLCLVDFACRKGIHELQEFHENISYLQGLVYSGGTDEESNFSISLVAWELLSGYEKFKMMLKGVKEETAIEILNEIAVPFMHNRYSDMTSLSDQRVEKDGSDHDKGESYLVRWMKEIATENKLGICLMVIEEGCKEFQSNGIFKDEFEAVYCALECIYASLAVDSWSTMSAILSKLPDVQCTDLSFEALAKRVRMAEGHIEAGRLLAFYQVPKPMSFFIEAFTDGRGVKQIIRLMLSKFIRRQPGRSDNDWASMWRDMQSLREKAFPFLDLEYLLVEFCRGLLKAGKFSLARNYLNGTASVALGPERAENLVIQAAREYFFSASSLACSEIWKAKECLNILPTSRNVKAEVDIIDAITIKLPELGLTLLPMQFRQIKDPMEIVRMAIISQSGAYLHVDELIGTAKLLGLTSPDDISAVEEAIAREAAVAGDLQLAFDLCLVLAKKGHGLIWDLCAAIARGPALENMDISSRKRLLGFALSHCDEESIGELLHAWKDLDMQGQCEKLIMLTKTNPPYFSVQGSSISSIPVHGIEDIINLREYSELVESASSDNHEVHINGIKSILHSVAKNLPVENGTDWDSLLRENGKILSFAALQLPWLLELSRRTEPGKNSTGSIFGKQYVNVRIQAVLCILSWLARNGFAPRDDLVASLARLILEPPVAEEEDILGGSFLLNLVDAFNGIELIEEQLRSRTDYQETSRMMNVGMIYSFVNNSGIDCDDPAQRRELLLTKFREKHLPLGLDEMNKIDKAQFTFWREWKLKLEEQKHFADCSRVLEQIIPGVETARFLSGDFDYIQSTVLSVINSVKFEKKHILKDVLELADNYGLCRSEVLISYLCSILVSEVWSNDEITAEVSEFQGEVYDAAANFIKAISLIVYPQIDGKNKQRLAYIYGLLSKLYLKLKKTKECLPNLCSHLQNVPTIALVEFYQVVEQECGRVSVIKNLNFKNIIELNGLNVKCFNQEIYDHIDELTLEPLAKLVETLVSCFGGPLSRSVMSGHDVYKHYVLNLLATLETKASRGIHVGNPETLQNLIIDLERVYGLSIRYIKLMTCSDALDITKRYLTVIIPCGGFSGNLDSSMWQDCLVMLINFWIRLADDMNEIATDESSNEQCKFNAEYLMKCLRAFMKLVLEETISPCQGWTTVTSVVDNDTIVSGSVNDIFIFCRALIFSACGFEAIAEVFSKAVAEVSISSTSIIDTEREFDQIHELPNFYLQILESVLQELVSGTHDCQTLSVILSSLSKLEGDIEELKRVRHAIWERLAKFSEDLHLPNHVRVSVLELMHCTAGKNFNSNSSEQHYNVRPWEAWDELPCTSRHGGTTSNDGTVNHMDRSSKVTNILVALKSSQLAAAISPTIEITADELLDAETAVSCYLKLCKAASTGSHLDALLAILGEWQCLFVNGKEEQASAREESGEGDEWSNDNWDEGWESFQEELPEEEKKKDSPTRLHPLHVCWMEILKRLLMLSRCGDVLQLIDQNLAKPYGLLLDEDGAKSLSKMVLKLDCFVALKMALLLPYEASRFQCLDAVEDKLKRVGILDAVDCDHELLLLALSSGIVPTIITKSTYGSTFSYLCYLVGNFSRQLQEAESLKCKSKEMHHQQKNDSRDFLFLFREILFPCFVAELVKADQQILAGFLVTKFMHTNTSLSLINIAEASLARFLETQLRKLQAQGLPPDLGSSETLANSVCQLGASLESTIQTGLACLPSNKR